MVGHCCQHIRFHTVVGFGFNPAASQEHTDSHIASVRKRNIAPVWRALTGGSIAHCIVEESVMTHHSLVYLPDTILYVGYWCRSGKHRSVAMTRIGARCLKAVGHNVITSHLCEHCWSFSKCNSVARRNCGQGARCQECFGCEARKKCNLYIDDKLVKAGIIQWNA